MLHTIFLTLIVVRIAILIAYIVSERSIPLPEQLREIKQDQTRTLMTNRSRAVLIFFVGAVMLLIGHIGLIGMAFGWTTGRWLFLAYVLADNCLIPIISPINILTGWCRSLEGFGNAISGIILTLAFLGYH